MALALLIPMPPGRLPRSVTEPSACHITAYGPPGWTGGKEIKYLWLEFITSPQRPVVQVASRLRFSSDTPCIKDSVTCLKPHMRIHLPSNLEARPVAIKPGPSPCSGRQWMDVTESVVVDHRPAYW